MAPTCIGLILDGNRRWAKARSLPSFAGHQAGYERLKAVVCHARDAGVPHVVAYVFSTENWQRPPEEVRALMTLFRGVLQKDTAQFVRERIRVRFVGERDRFDAPTQKLMAEMEVATGKERAYDTTLHLLLSYGGRAEIVAAARALAAEGADITEETFAQKLWSHPMPDPDLIIRTGGEKRLSNFLPWQSTYSELSFLDTLWPDFSREEFNAVLAEFASRERRHGR